MAEANEVIIIGGGAAGFFAAINMAETNPDLNVTVLERGSKVLQKVKVSGGGRCNVTHACFDPKDLASYYHRGQKELLGPFHTFMTGDTMEWFEQRGVSLKVEDDMRVFPESDSSQTIIDCFQSSAVRAGVQVKLNEQVINIKVLGKSFIAETKSSRYTADRLVITTGGNSKIWGLVEQLGHRIIQPVPSLFTFNINDQLLEGLPGISVPNAQVKVLGDNFESSGPMLITHWGISGPAVLKLSSMAAIDLAGRNYDFQVTINWLNQSFDSILNLLKEQKQGTPRTKVVQRSPFSEIPKRLWERLVRASGIDLHRNWSDLSFKELEMLSSQISKTQLHSRGKTTFKEEFVTAGGIDLKEVNFKKFESKLVPGLYFAGEVLNIDGLTGGFNFQNAWTGAYIAAKAIADDQ